MGTFQTSSLKEFQDKWEPFKSPLPSPLIIWEEFRTPLGSQEFLLNVHLAKLFPPYPPPPSPGVGGYVALVVVMVQVFAHTAGSHHSATTPSPNQQYRVLHVSARLKLK